MRAGLQRRDGRDDISYVRAADEPRLRHRAAIHRFVHLWLETDATQLGDQAPAHSVVRGAVDGMGPLVSEDSLQASYGSLSVEFARRDMRRRFWRRDQDALEREACHEQREYQQCPKLFRHEAPVPRHRIVTALRALTIGGVEPNSPPG